MQGWLQRHDRVRTKSQEFQSYTSSYFRCVPLLYPYSENLVWSRDVALDHLAQETLCSLQASAVDARIQQQI